MANAGDIIKHAMQDLSVLAAGKIPTSQENADCLVRLNAMLEQYSISSLLVPYRGQITHTMDGSTSYTVGSGGDINVTRPTYIVSAFSRRNEIDYQLHIARSVGEYDQIIKKNITGIPRFIYYEPEVPLGRLYVYYAGTAEDTMHLSVRGQLEEFVDTTTDVSLAPGYYEMLYSNLAINVAPMFEVTATAELVKKARDSMARIKRLNRQSPVMRYDDAIPRSRNYYNIESDA